MVTFEEVFEYNSVLSNSIQIEMNYDGFLRITVLHLSAKDGLVGLSDGMGLSPYFEESNFSESYIA